MTTNINVPSDGPITIQIGQVGGDLRVSGKERSDISCQTDGESFEYETEGNTVKLAHVPGDCILEVPRGCSLDLGQIGGDAQVKQLQGSVLASVIGGDLRVRKVGSLNLTSLGGDLSLKKVSGDVVVEHVGGDTSCIDIKGQVEVKCGGDMALSNVEGAITAVAGGDAALRLQLADELTYSVTAGGDISCYLPEETSARVVLKSGSHTLRVRGWQPPPPPEDELYEFTLGEGSASLNLNAGGDISLISHQPGQEEKPWFDFDFEFDLGPDLHFEFDKGSGFRPEMLSDAISVRVQQKVQNAMRQAEEKIASAISHAESRIAQAEQRAADMESKWSGRRRDRRHRPRAERGDAASRRKSRRSESSSSQGEKPSVSQEERIMVLRMVEEGKISVEQAEKLLAAMN